jgi:hypothetical protein
LEVTVFTRSMSGAKFTLTDADTKKIFLEDVEVSHNGTEDASEKSSSKVINMDALIKGPAHVKIKADSHAGRFSTQNYLLVYRFLKA